MDLIQYYKTTREKSVLMCQPLETEDYVPQVAFFASPPKWNLAHTSWFFEEFILKHNYPRYSLYNPVFSFLFNSYYEGAGKRSARDERGTYSRPTVKEIYTYRDHIDSCMIELLSGNIGRETEELVILGLNHEQQHQELFFADHKYSLSRNPLYPVYGSIPFAEQGEMPPLEFIMIEEGIYETGFKGEDFAFDNEKPSHKVFLQQFEISNRLENNGDFLAFINDGGYKRHEFWHEEGWKWVNEYEIDHPLYWKKDKSGWHQFTLAGLRPLNAKDPLTHLNYYEAFAFAQWKGMRLPTEFEWEAASEKINWGDRWEWTESAYLPYPGYKKAEGTVGEYNGKFMVNQKVLRGSSVVTPVGHERKTYRNFFHPNMNWQFTGIRLVK